MEMFRSVLAQLEFTYIVQKYDAAGTPFRTHLHVPEVHPITRSIFYEREDEGHVLKVAISLCILTVAWIFTLLNLL